MEGIEGLAALTPIGSGGFADVYRASEPSLHREVAVKVFRQRLDDRDRLSFERESAATGRLSGIRNVVQVYRSGVTTEGRPYLVMQLMEGSLQDELARGPVPVTAACRAGAMLGDALAEAHARGILHRDIKPANVLIDRYGDPALSDFGIARFSGAENSSTVGGAFSEEHAAPEVFEGRPATEACDVYSLAATVFTMIEGHPPFTRLPDEGPMPFMQRVATSECPPCAAAAEVSPELDSLLRHALDTDPEQRPTLPELVAGLRVVAGTGDPAAVEALGGSPDHGTPWRPRVGASTGPPPPAPNSPEGTPTGARRGRRGGYWLAAAAVLAVLGAAWWVLTTSSSTDDEPAPVRTGAERPAGNDSPTTATGSPTTAPVIFDGVADLRPLPEPKPEDTSPQLREQVNAFAAASTLPVLSRPPAEFSGRDLKFGDPPSMLNFGAVNKISGSPCRRVQLNDLVIEGAAGSIWLDDQNLVIVNAISLQTQLQARRYFWATALFLGLRDENCSGWPADGVAVDPRDLVVERDDLGLGGAEDVVTVTNLDARLEGLRTGVAHEMVVRLGRTVVVATISFPMGIDDPELARSVYTDMIAAFSTR